MILRTQTRAPVLALVFMLTAFAAGAAPASQGDQEPKARFEGSVDVQEVQLDVLVTDKRGDVIVGLTPQDFVVEEDGEPVELSGATFYSSSELLGSPRAVTAGGADIDTAPKDRYFILFFDDQKTNQDSGVNLMQRQLQAARDARRWIDGELAPADWVAVLGYDFKLKLYLDFSRDRQAIDGAIERAVTGKGDGANWPSRQSAAEGAPSLAARMPTGDELRDRSPRIYEALGLVADASSAIAGRKNLVLFSIGFGNVDNFGIYQRDPRYYPPMVHALNDANVAVYAVDLTPSDVRHPLSNALNDLASETGGRFFDRFTSFLTPLRQISEENSGYYLLSYTARHPAGEEGFQQVSVKTVDPDLVVRARKGYEY